MTNNTERGNVQFLPIPENLSPNYVCMMIDLPDDPEYIQAFVGKLQQLAFWKTYERDAGKNGKIVADIWKVTEKSLRVCKPDCGCGSCDDCDCDDCGEGVNNMADSVKDIIYDEENCAYKVIYCSGAEVLLPPIPPDCAVVTPPPTIPPNGKTRCWKLGVMSHFTNAFFDSFAAAICPFSFTPTDPLLGGAIMAWMVSNHIPVLLYPALFHFAVFQFPADAGNVCSLIYGMDDNYLANIMDCCWTTDERIDDDFISCVRLNMNEGEVFDLRSEPEQDYLKQESIFMGIFDAAFWYDFYFVKLSDAEHPDYVDCGSFTSCSEQVGCLPEALYQTTIFRYNDPQMGGEGASDSCYGAGVYAPCTPFNSILAPNNAWIDLGAQACFKMLRFSMGGNSQTRWVDVEFLIDDVVVGNYLNTTESVRCGDTGSPWSATIVLPSPIQGQKFSIRPTRKVGANPAYGVNIHCIEVEYAYL